MNSTIQEFMVGPLSVKVLRDKEAVGKEAALHAIPLIQEAIRRKGIARIVFSAANSQLDLAANLTSLPGIDWSKVEVFHVDEWVGVTDSHPASFRKWVKNNVVDRVHPAKVHYLAGDAKDLAAECQRYSDLLASSPIDVSFLGFGENGHIGFNDPHEANFADPKRVRSVTLDERCRMQQLNEGHWSSFEDMPTLGVTLTCPALIDAAHVICCVPELRKAEAVRNALRNPVSTACPGSFIRTHPRANLYLDFESASLLTKDNSNAN